MSQSVELGRRPDDAWEADRADLADPLTHDGGLAPSRGLIFRPEVFFLGRTEGAGVVRNPFGAIMRRCQIVTEGVFSAAYRAIHFDETFTYDDGEIDVWRWVMGVGREGRYIAAEALAGGGIVGEERDGDWLVNFRRPVGAARGLFAPHFATRFTLLSPDLALKRSRASLLGAPIGVLTAVHRRIGKLSLPPGLTPSGRPLLTLAAEQ